MDTNPLVSPVVVDGIVSEEKVAELLALQTEYPELDYKSTIDVDSNRGFPKLVEAVGAMSVRGGYILGGVDNNGGLTAELDEADMRPFDEANLRPKLLRFLPRSLEIRTNVVEREGHKVVVICVLPNPAGCAFFQADGKYQDGDRETTVFREGDVFWRDGTRSVRMNQEGLEEVIRRRIATEKERWFEEQEEIRRRERSDRETSYEARRLAEAPLGEINLDLDSSELTFAALDLIRRGDDVALRYLLNDAAARARQLIDAGDIEQGLANLLDKVTCLAATFLEYEQDEWFERAIQLLVEVYSMPFDEDDARRFGYSARISPEELAPRVWLVVIERVFALGALAIRRERWEAIRVLTLQLPHPLRPVGYDKNWLRHALTMVSRAQHLEEGGQKSSLLSLARVVAARLDCLRPDGLGPEDDQLLTSLAQFDILSNVAAIDDAGDAEKRVFYSNFARFRQDRVQAIIERLLTERRMREFLFHRDDRELALALHRISHLASEEGWRYDGFEGWGGTPVGKFIEEQLPEIRPDQ